MNDALQTVLVFSPAAAIVGIVAHQTRAYRRDVARARDVKFAPRAARAHGSRQPIPPAPTDEDR